MGRKLSKKQAALKRKANKAKRDKRTERLEAKGLNRKNQGRVISFKTFYIVKFLIALLTICAYFWYSSLLIVLVIATILSYFLAIWCERGLNKSYLKINQISLLKFDIGLAFSLIVITSFATIFNLGTKTFRHFRRFNSNWFTKFIDNVKGFGTLLTGERSLFAKQFDFSMVKPPEDFGAIDPSTLPSGRMAHPPTLDDIPLEFIFSNLLSTLMSVMIFIMAALSILTIIHGYLKIKQQSKTLDDCLIDDKIKILDDTDIIKILDFGNLEEKEED